MSKIELNPEKIMKKRKFENDHLFIRYLSKIMDRYLGNDKSYTASDYFDWAKRTKQALEINSLNEQEVMDEFFAIREKRRTNDFLLNACADGDMMKIKEALERGADVNYIHEARGINLYQTVLFNGADNNSTQVLEFMLNNFKINLVKIQKHKETEKFIDLNNRMLLNCTTINELNRISRLYKDFDLFEKHLSEYRNLRPNTISLENLENLLKTMYVKINLN